MTKHYDRGNGFTMCNERIDDRTQFGVGCYYCKLAIDQGPPCKCGSYGAYWSGDTMRVYACKGCHLLRLGKEEHP